MGVNAVKKYSLQFGINSQTRGVLTHGNPGSGKSFILLAQGLYALSQGLRVLPTSLMAKRSNSLGGRHLHRLFQLDVNKSSANPRRVAEASQLFRFLCAFVTYTDFISLTFCTIFIPQSWQSKNCTERPISNCCSSLWLLMYSYSTSVHNLALSNYLSLMSSCATYDNVKYLLVDACCWVLLSKLAISALHVLNLCSSEKILSFKCSPLSSSAIVNSARSTAYLFCYQVT